MEVRTNYFGTCFRLSVSHLWTCENDASGLASLLEPSEDPLNLLWLSMNFRKHVLFPAFT